MYIYFHHGVHRSIIFCLLPAFLFACFVSFFRSRRFFRCQELSSTWQRRLTTFAVYTT